MLLVLLLVVVVLLVVVACKRVVEENSSVRPEDVVLSTADATMMTMTEQQVRRGDGEANSYRHYSCYVCMCRLVVLR